MTAAVLASDNHLKPGMPLENGREAGEQLRRDDEETRPAVAQHEIVVGGGQQGVDRNRHDPRLDCAEKGGREIDAVEQAVQDALLRQDAHRGDEIGEAVDALGEIGIAVGAAIVADGDLLRPAGVEVAADEIDGGVVGAWQGRQGWLPAAFSTLPDHRASPDSSLVGYGTGIVRPSRRALRALLRMRWNIDGTHKSSSS